VYFTLAGTTGPQEAQGRRGPCGSWHYRAARSRKLLQPSHWKRPNPAKNWSDDTTAHGGANHEHCATLKQLTLRGAAMFGAMKKLWSSSGYWAGVVVEFGQMTGTNLEQMAKATNSKHLLDAFCAEAQKRGLSEQQCAQVIHDYGFQDLSVLDGCDKLFQHANNTQGELTDTFRMAGLDFMQLDATVHGALLKEAMVTGIDATMETFTKTCEELQRAPGDDETKAKVLREWYGERGERFDEALKKAR
jgi:hypothetical protein